MRASIPGLPSVSFGCLPCLPTATIIFTYLHVILWSHRNTRKSHRSFLRTVIIAHPCLFDDDEKDSSKLQVVSCCRDKTSQSFHSSIPWRYSSYVWGIPIRIEPETEIWIGFEQQLRNSDVREMTLLLCKTVTILLDLTCDSPSWLLLATSSIHFLVSDSIHVRNIKCHPRHRNL